MPSSAYYEVYRHTPLDLIEGRIRLLRVIPDLSNTGHIQCQIWNDTVEAEYTCLSYTWGSECHEKEILINGKLFQCRENLWDFLRIARKKQSTAAGALWIDAICIDQAKIPERNQQVSQMGDIYSSAARVLIWLGRDESIARFLSFMHGLVDNLPEVLDARQVRKYWYQNKSRQTQLDWHDFLACPYWTRAWITQEIALSRSSQVLAGDIGIGISEIKAIQTLLLRVGEPHSPSGPAFADAEPWIPSIDLIEAYLDMMSRDISTEHGMKRDLHNRTVLDLGYSLAGRGSQEPRDRIFSLRAIAQDGSKIAIDYQGTDLDCFLHTAKALSRNVCFCSLSFLARTMGCTSLVDKESRPSLPDVTVALPIKKFQSQQDPHSLDWDKEWIVHAGYQCLYASKCHLIIAKDGTNLRVCTQSREEFTLPISKLVVMMRENWQEKTFVVINRQDVKEGVALKPDPVNEPTQRADEWPKVEPFLEISMPIDSWIRITSAFEADDPTWMELCNESCHGWESPLSIGLENMVFSA